MLPHSLLPAALALLIASAFAHSTPRLDRVTFQGQEIFLNGLNLAWGEYPDGRVSFADDVGPDPRTPNLRHFEEVFARLKAHGGNSLRLWIHTTGRFTPEWSGHFVSGPGDDTIEDLRAILDLAEQYDIGLIPCLWSFDMLRMENGTHVTDRAFAILTQPENRQSYLDHALAPMVQALKGHPALLAWEIFNEPEGMSEEHGWAFNRQVPMAAIQAFINQSAGTIRRADPNALISNGAWAFIATSDVGEGNFNYYTDARLLAAGGDPDGYLDFYMVHYYDWAGPERSPFHFPASHWGLDKPLVVGEFYPDCDHCGDSPHQTLLNNGYAGALGWSWTDRDPQILLDAISRLAE